MVGREDLLCRLERLRLGNERRFRRPDAELSGVPGSRRRLLFSPISQYVLISPLPCKAQTPLLRFAVDLSNYKSYNKLHNILSCQYVVDLLQAIDFDTYVFLQLYVDMLWTFDLL